MKRKGWNFRGRILPLVLFLVASLTVLVQAQQSCPQVTFLNRSSTTLDQEAICQAAQPWGQQGIQLFVFLTDREPANEQEWFNILDQAEAQAGIRDPSQADSFQRNALAFEATTATDLPFAVSITYGERLYGTPLDTDQAALDRVKTELRNGIAQGDATTGFVDAIQAAYGVTYPVVATATPLPAQPTSQILAAPPPSGSSFPWGWVIGGLFVVVILGSLGFVLYTTVIGPALQRARDRAALRRHLETLKARTANLLNALAQLLPGDTPGDTVLYQLFSAYGGEKYPDLHAQVWEWLRLCQAALDDAFDLRQKLREPAVQEARTLEQQVRDWEMLYITIVGSSERVTALTDAELRTLLDPLLTLQTQEQPDAPLASQLDQLRRELAGTPLRVDLQMVDPAQVDTRGILGYIDAVKTELSRLATAREEAPQRLEEAHDARRSIEEELPDPFGMTEIQLLGAIDARLADAATDLQEELFLDAIEAATAVREDLAVVDHYLKAFVARQERQAELQAIVDQGYRPARLASDLGEIEADLEHIIQEMEDGDYAAAQPWVEELETDSQRALATAKSWRALHEQNAASLGALRDTLARVGAILNDQVAPALEALQDYPVGNWADVRDSMEDARKTLRRLREQELASIEDLNSMAQQGFPQAEQQLAKASAELAEAERRLQAVPHRLEEVRAAETHIQEALALTEEELAQAVQLRDREDVKIGPEVDQQIEEAHDLLAEARRQAGEREFIAATEAQRTAHELAGAARASASRQVEAINALQGQLEALAEGAEAEAQRAQAAGQALPAVAQTATTQELLNGLGNALAGAQQARTATSHRQDQALNEALSAAVSAYEDLSRLADQAQAQITADRERYDHALTAARDAIHSAQGAVQHARWAVQDPDAAGAGLHSLQRAESLLSGLVVADDLPLPALERTTKRAEEALQDARRAEGIAREQIRATQAARWRRPTIVIGRSTSFGRSSSPGRGGWSGSSRRGGFSGSSRRSGGMGSSRRSSSTGSSRRR
jgi:hypothetical protein